MSWKNILKRDESEWQSIVKMPFIPFAGKSYRESVKNGGLPQNPIVFIDDPSELKGEVFDEKHITARYGTTYFFESNEASLSNYGRVKLNGKIVRPEKSAKSNRMNTKITGADAGSYKENMPFSNPSRRGTKEYQSKTTPGDEGQNIGQRTRSIPYSLTVDRVLLEIGMEIPDDAELFVSGQSIGTYGQNKESIAQAKQDKQSQDQQMKEKEEEDARLAQEKEEEEKDAQRLQQVTPQTSQSLAERRREQRRKVKQGKKGFGQRKLGTVRGGR